jgi:AraC family transcriptional regulator
LKTSSTPIFSPQGEFCGSVSGCLSFDRISSLETQFSKPTAVPLHRHENPHFLLVLSGGFEVNAAGRRNSLALGDAIFQEAGVMHSGQVFTHVGHGFSVELTENENLHPPTGGIEGYARRTRISSLLTQIYRESRIQDAAQRFAIEGLVLLVLATLLREAEPAASQPPQWISRATQLLEDSACENRTMDELSRILGVAQKEIATSFRKYLQCTPAEYQRTQRLEVARRYLAESNYSIARIAAETGFCDQAYLCHEFKRVMSCTPSQYRALFQRRKLRTPS